MANKRIITSAMWEDEFFTSLPIFDRLLWVGLITCVADDQGRLQDNPALIRSKVFPLDDIPISDIETALSRFLQASKIVRYIADGKRVIQIFNWWKHQTPQWAGRSNFPPPDNWMDRERFHGKENKIITCNWDCIGGYIAGYIPGKRSNDINGDSDGKGDIKGDGEGEHSADLFDIFKHALENNGIVLAGADDIAAITEIEKMGATVEDMLAGLRWKAENNHGKPVRYVSAIVGPTRTSMQKRLQGAYGGNGQCHRQRLLIGADGKQYLEDIPAGEQ
jgi:hypothetical protein